MYVFFGLLKVNGGVRILLVYFGQRRCTYFFGLLKVNGGVRIFWFT